MFLYAEHPNGKKIGTKKLTAMSHEVTRGFLQEKFGPQAKVLSPLEAKQAGPVLVLTVYGSQTADGKSRMTQLEQWGIQ